MNFGVNPYQPPVDDSAAAPARAPQVDAATAKAIEDKINRLNRNSLLLGVLGAGLQSARFMATPARPGAAPEVTPAAAVLSLTGFIVLAYAFSLYARMRNRSPWWGALGLLSCLGLLVLLFLQKRCHFCNAPTKGKTCDKCGAPAPK